MKATSLHLAKVHQLLASASGGQQTAGLSWISPKFNSPPAEVERWQKTVENSDNKRLVGWYWGGQ
jgi:hypothetical protein